MAVVCDGKETSRGPPSYMGSYFNWGEICPIDTWAPQLWMPHYGDSVFAYSLCSLYNLYGAPYEYGVGQYGYSARVALMLIYCYLPIHLTTITLGDLTTSQEHAPL